MRCNVVRALHYHFYALAPLVLLAEFGAANRLDLYAVNDGAIHHMVRRSVAGLEDSGPFEHATGSPKSSQRRPVGTRWLDATLSPTLP